MMDDAPNAAMAEYWNDAAGPVWVELQADLDRQTGPLGAAALRALAPSEGERILDVGCGCGETTWQLAAMVGHAGAVVGADLSAPMLAVARARKSPEGAPRPTFRQADAQTDDLGGGFDAAFSRFGVMFFSDPTAAFANIRAALKSGGRLAFVCWRPLKENPMMYAPSEAAAHLTPPSPPADPTAPGPFAFADADRLRGILTAAGYSDIAIEPFDTKVGGADLDGAVALALRVGPLGARLREDPSLVSAVRPAVRERLTDYLIDGKVMFPAAVWIVSARA
jgi:SAM-dependent methyltransferase